ncbi:hypothetical protein GIB67_022271 [Kingdonia uniflora]|uniref:C2H2-type domain-containing protein n=1 Tax=Kingdonia uniflora TaxID=39325 RepID=A0A7J7M703_9MAGN|nr:hypothetical protein GIB67_022271 [Kingdonia uniflora]
MGKKHKEKQEELKAKKMAAINKVSFLPNEAGETKATIAKCNAAPGSSVLEKFLKEWSCDICQVKTSGKGNLRDHLRRKKHKEKQEEINANKMATKNKGISKQNDIDDPTLGSKMACYSSHINIVMMSFVKPSSVHKLIFLWLRADQSLPAKLESKVLATECPRYPDSPALVTTQREWTCALCQMSTSSKTFDFFNIIYFFLFLDGEGKVHWKGVAYYNRLIDYLPEKGNAQISLGP